MMLPASPEAFVDDYIVPKPPPHLRRHGKKLWRTVCADWELEHDASDLEVLALAAEAADRAAQAREELRQAGGLTILDRFGTVKPHPAVEIESKARAQAAALVEQISRGQIAFRRLELASERQERAGERAARAEEDPRQRSRRGGGARHFPRPSHG